MKLRKLLESLSDWGTQWIHYSKHSMLSINPHQFHQDPAGIYFFPIDYVPPVEMWHDMPYKYVATITPKAKILDASHITKQEIEALVNAAGITGEFENYITKYPPQDINNEFKMAWELLRRHYALTLFKKYGAFNALFQKLGWDAIFDDTEIIHRGEPQLLVLNRKIITSIRQVTGKSNTYAAMQKVLVDLKQLGEQFGPVEISPITRPNKNTHYINKDKLLLARLQIGDDGIISRSHERYVIINISISKDRPNYVYFSIYLSNPRLNYGVGNEYFIPKGTYRDPLDRIKEVLITIFHKENTNEN